MTLYLLDLAGVAVFAASGVLAAGRKELDLVGVTVVAAVTAVGGGTLRDLLLDRHPIFWGRDPAYLCAIAAAVPATILVARLGLLPRRPLAAADAIGLGLFAVSGGRIADAAGVAWPVVLLMGAMTGVAGGVIRDVLTNEVPLVLRPGELYATTALAGAAVDLATRRLGLHSDAALVAGAATVILLRLATVYRGWSLPAVRLTARPAPLADGKRPAGYAAGPDARGSDSRYEPIPPDDAPTPPA